MYISRRVMYIFSAGNVYLPPRFITSRADRKTWRLQRKTSGPLTRTWLPWDEGRGGAAETFGLLRLAPNKPHGVSGDTTRTGIYLPRVGGRAAARSKDAACANRNRLAAVLTFRLKHEHEAKRWLRAGAALSRPAIRRSRRKGCSPFQRPGSRASQRRPSTSGQGRTCSTRYLRGLRGP